VEMHGSEDVEKSGEGELRETRRAAATEGDEASCCDGG
jgi:hypothetical protein